MGLTSGELSAADVAAVMGNNGGNAGLASDGSTWIIILFLFALMGGYGNGFGNGGGFAPWMMNTNNDVQRGFDQNAVMNGISGLTNAVSAGFANAEVSRCNGMTNILQALNTNQSMTNQNMNTLAMSLQQGIYNQNLATNDLKYVIATENCADRAAVTDALRNVIEANTASTQRILDQMCQDKIDAKNEQINSLQTQLYLANLAASQTAQTAQLIANNEAQTAILQRSLGVNGCCNQYASCGCGM